MGIVGGNYYALLGTIGGLVGASSWRWVVMAAKKMGYISGYLLWVLKVARNQYGYITPAFLGSPSEGQLNMAT